MASRSAGCPLVASPHRDRDPAPCLRRLRRKGFSLLEVVLALAILGGAVAVTGELVRVGIESARIARDLTYAQLLCESKLAEITAGADVPDAVTDVPFETTEDSSQPDWLYSIEATPLDEEGLTAVRVTVYKEVPEGQRPVTFSLDRWIIDTGGTTTGSGMGGA